MNKKWASAAATITLAAGLTIGNIVPPILVVSDFSKVFFAPGDWREIVVSTPAGPDTIPHSFGKMGFVELYQDSMIILMFPKSSLLVWPPPTHYVELRSQLDTTLVDYWWSFMPTLFPVKPDSLDWWAKRVMAGEDSTIQWGTWIIGECTFCVIPDPESPSLR